VPDDVVVAASPRGVAAYFGTAERVSQGRAFIEAALASAEEVPLPLRLELLGYLCYLATEDDDLEAAVEAGERGLALAAKGDAPWETAMLKLPLGFACDRAGLLERAVALAEEARRAFDELGDRWGAASSAVTGALGALRGGDLATASALVAEAVRLHAGYEVGAAPAALLEALLAERGATGRRRPPRTAGRSSFPSAPASRTTLRSRSPASARSPSRTGTSARPKRSIAARWPSPTPSASWLVAHVKARLAQVLAAVGNPESAVKLYRSVVAWSEQPRRHDAREALHRAGRRAGHGRTRRPRRACGRARRQCGRPRAARPSGPRSRLSAS
jgi:hypothetical protein